ncbi:MAG: hypothetical protein QOF14_1952 [Hyphomicrobiales bacterium]|nr:hypothetical protein [Hyphomicrobiales bacterium]
MRRTLKLRRALAALACLVLLPATAGAQSDSTFNPSDWTSGVQASPSGSTCVAIQDFGQGLPRPSRQTTHTTPKQAQMWCTHTFIGVAPYNPAQGAITSISYSFDAAHYTTGVVPHSILIYQNGTYYRSLPADQVAGKWNPYSGNNLTAANFARIPGGDSLAEYPDFSCKGSQIVFGYVTHTGNNNVFPETKTSAIDNWQISIDATTPCGETKESSNTYAAKFICGVQPDSNITHIPDAETGRYATKVNVHNNTGNTIKFRKKIIHVRGGQQPYAPQFKIEESLQPDEAMEVVCADIYDHLKMLPLPPPHIPPYIEGWVVLEVYVVVGQGKPAVPPPDPLDVVGVYTYKGDIPPILGNPATGSGVSINVVVYPAKSNRHTLD